jgi:hypothetical protein
MPLLIDSNNAEGLTKSELQEAVSIIDRYLILADLDESYNLTHHALDFLTRVHQRHSVRISVATFERMEDKTSV